jgi:hypothetical protein
MATRKQRPLLRRPFDGDRILSDSELGRRLLKAGKVPPGNGDRFLIGVSASIDQYLKRAAHLQAGEVQTEIAALASAALKALEGDESAATRVADLLEALSPDARVAIELRAVYCTVPTRGDLKGSDKLRRQEALELIRGLCVTGGTYVDGRLRPTGRRSRRVLRPHYSSPPVTRRRPPNDAELELCMFLAIDYAEATGRSPVRYRRGKQRGPFVDFVREVLNSVGAATVNAEKLVRRHDERQRTSREEVWVRWRRRLRHLHQLRQGAW